MSDKLFGIRQINPQLYAIGFKNAVCRHVERSGAAQPLLQLQAVVRNVKQPAGFGAGRCKYMPAAPTPR